MTPLPSPGLFISLLSFILVFGTLVFVHELGHYLVGRWCGIRADAFSIGFGKEIAGWTDKRGTRWKLGLLPLGGYVQFAGDRDPSSAMADPAAKADPTSFPGASLGRRTLTVLAGPLANFLFAFLILTGFALALGVPSTPPVVQQVAAGSAAERAGLMPGDRIISIDGSAVAQFEEMPLLIAHRAGEPMAVVIDRSGQRSSITMTPTAIVEKDRFGKEVRRGIIGVAPGPMEIKPVSLIEAPVFGARATVRILGQMAATFRQLVTGQRSIKDMGGPVRIAQASGEMATLGWLALVQFIALLSLNLGLVNLLPLPMLDGGHLTFYALEAIRRKPLDEAWQAAAIRAGFALVITLTLIITFNDLASIGLW